MYLWINELQRFTKSTPCTISLYNNYYLPTERISFDPLYTIVDKRNTTYSLCTWDRYQLWFNRITRGDRIPDYLTTWFTMMLNLHPVLIATEFWTQSRSFFHKPFALCVALGPTHRQGIYRPHIATSLPTLWYAGRCLLICEQSQRLFHSPNNEPRIKQPINIMLSVFFYFI